MEQEKTPFYIYVIRVLLVVVVLFFIVAFVHDLFTGQLPGGSSGICEQYKTQEAFEACADSVMNSG
jgi:hypothetical protein